MVRVATMYIYFRLLKARQTRVTRGDAQLAARVIGHCVAMLKSDSKPLPTASTCGAAAAEWSCPPSASAAVTDYISQCVAPPATAPAAPSQPPPP